MHSELVSLERGEVAGGALLYPVVADARSLRYHRLGCASLPREAAQVWFATEAGAMAAGYRPHCDCVAPGGAPSAPPRVLSAAELRRSRRARKAIHRQAHRRWSHPGCPALPAREYGWRRNPRTPEIPMPEAIRHRASVDRIEGERAVLLLGERGERQIVLPVDLLPPGTREGDVLQLTIAADAEARRQLEEEIRRLMHDLGSP